MTTASATPTMTQKDWELVQQAYDFETTLISEANEVKVVKGPRKEKLTQRAKEYKRFLEANAVSLAKAFGDEEVVNDMRMSLHDLMHTRLGMAA